jgi:hypothetical protein
MEVDMCANIHCLTPQVKTKYKCSACKESPFSASYHGQVCQIDDWPLHKLVCRSRTRHLPIDTAMTEGDPHYQAMMAIVSDPRNDPMHTLRRRLDGQRRMDNWSRLRRVPTHM